MSLPKLAYPTYVTSLASNPKKTVKYRPFLVKEEKALLLAKQSESVENILATVENVIRACVEDKLGELTVIDTEFLFLKIRSKSVGETSEVSIRCQTPGCSGTHQTTIDFDNDVKVVRPEGHSQLIEIQPGMTLKMKYPTLTMAKKMPDVTDNDSMNLVIDCIESLTFDGEVFLNNTQNKEEFREFIENLTDAQFSKIKEFFDTIPYIGYSYDWNCPVCQHNNHVELRGIESFF